MCRDHLQVDYYSHPTSNDIENSENKNFFFSFGYIYIRMLPTLVQSIYYNRRQPPLYNYGNW